jgi:hypothetical protein
MVVLADDARPDERGQLGGRAALRVHVGKLEDRCTLTGDGVLPDLTDLDRCEVWRDVRVGMRHANDHYHPDPFLEKPSRSPLVCWPIAPRLGGARPECREFVGWLASSAITVRTWTQRAKAGPLWALGNVADDYVGNANGGFAVGQALVRAPAVGTMVVARSWAEWRWLPTLALSVACFFACGMAMLVAFVIVLPLFLDSF